ncbi:MAG: hypothetical protein AB7U73_17015, partial [Pirellulales bacterium]
PPAGGPAENDNFDVIFAESRPVPDEPADNREGDIDLTSALDEAIPQALDPQRPASDESPDFGAPPDFDDDVAELTFEKADALSDEDAELAALDLGDAESIADESSAEDAEPDFPAFDEESPPAENLFADESPNGRASAADEIERAAESADEAESQFPGAGETVDDNLLDDFFKNF